ncbi:hypothetical protein IEQ34_019224 [Dendrobium chrysotoxum]|uniref:Uncharacterized protein n=1 Tax=Dendrobium chrysotoxum TaxID=161865 RepID=A0AAV7G820_DENCH|nr:hypothetical protein IEQ34_019224 [Dendrobium chrysotoxum]
MQLASILAYVMGDTQSKPSGSKEEEGDRHLQGSRCKCITPITNLQYDNHQLAKDGDKNIALELNLGIITLKQELSKKKLIRRGGVKITHIN